MLWGKTTVGIGARTAELAARMGADVIGVDLAEPVGNVDSFVSADIATREGVETLAASLPDRLDAPCNVPGFSGVAKAAAKRGVEDGEGYPVSKELPLLWTFRAVLRDARVDSDIGRAGNAGDIAPVILFLRSDAARWINGANVPVDGGLEASVNAEAPGF